jgi:hypothetical protein
MTDTTHASPSELALRETERKRQTALDMIAEICGRLLPRSLADHDHALGYARAALAERARSVRTHERAADDSEPHVIYTRDRPNGEAVTANAVNGSITRLIGAYISRDLTPAGDRLTTLANYELSLLLGQLDAADRLHSQILAERDAARVEVARLRARVRVDASDIERTGVSRAHVEAWLRSHGWTEVDTDYAWVAYADPACSSADVCAAVDVWRKTGYTAVERSIWNIGDHTGRPELDILDEMAAMVVAPHPKE